MTDAELLVRIRQLKHANNLRMAEAKRLGYDWQSADIDIQAYTIMLLDSVNEDEARRRVTSC